MRYRKLGDSETRVSDICLGTMTFGVQNTEAEGHGQHDCAFDHGINFIDAAEVYPVPPAAESSGRTEEIVGIWLHRQPRDRVILATKVAGPTRNLHGIRGGPLAVDRAKIRAALVGSLRRLRTEYVDLYRMQRPDRNTPTFDKYQFEPEQKHASVSVAEQIEALSERVRDGKIRYIGLSNEHPWGVSEFFAQAERRVVACVVSAQNAYSLVNRTFKTALAETRLRNGISLLAYSPVAFGLLSGKCVNRPSARGRVTIFGGCAQRYGKPNVRPAVAAYVDIAQRHGLAPAVLALAFARGRQFVGSTIVGATSLAQLEQNLSAGELDLSPELIDEVEQIHLRYTYPAP